MYDIESDRNYYCLSVCKCFQKASEINKKKINHLETHTQTLMIKLLKSVDSTK